MPLWQAVALRVVNFSMVGVEIPYFLFYQPDKASLIGFFAGLASGPAAYPAYNFLEIGQAWSISLEIWFYLMAPFLVKRSTAFLACVMAASIAMNFSAEAQGLPAYFFFPGQLYLFTTGIIVHRLYEKHRARIDAQPYGPFMLVGLVGVVLIYQWLPTDFGRLAVLAICTAAIPWLFSYFRNKRWDVELGNLSYAIYVCHGLVGSILKTVANLTDGMIVASASVAVSVLICFFLEKPIDQFRQRLAIASTG
jgi:peptidoglycan/LPS O-acetylase OafA/YrhL